MKMRILLRSGNELSIDVTEFSVKVGSITQELTGIDWTYADDAKQKLPYLRLEDVSAVIRVDES